MGELSIMEKLKRFIADIAFRLFLWGNGMTQDTYWQSIYEQEKGLPPSLPE